MKLSVVIVNYNVRDLLEQCLHAVQKACRNISAEVFVVDNNSKDGSQAMVRAKFPNVHLVPNTENAGFAKANNQAIRLAKGQYVLLLNPDTLVQEDTFRKSIDFMDNHIRAGALGVKMIDGSGKYLPESKRALPTPWVSFYKVFGLAALFPKSAKFNRYYLGNLSNDTVHEIEVLTGAYLFLRKSVLDEIGLLDETFFMYGEDIDLSYRVLQAGYKNYYLPTTTIVHYKGESTKKGSLNYVYIFYKAMQIFAQKHFAQSIPLWFSILIRAAIFFRAALSVAKRVFQRVFLPFFDVAAMVLFFSVFIPVWGRFLFGEGGDYPNVFKYVIVPIYVMVWFLSIFLSGNYHFATPFKLVARNICLATLMLLALYALLPNDFRFSRSAILLGGLAAILVALLSRNLSEWLNIKKVKPPKQEAAIVIADASEFDDLQTFIEAKTEKLKLVGFVAEKKDSVSLNPSVLGNLTQLSEIIRVNKVNQIIFSAKSLSNADVIAIMNRFEKQNMSFKIVSLEGRFIIGEKNREPNAGFFPFKKNTTFSK